MKSQEIANYVGNQLLSLRYLYAIKEREKCCYKNVKQLKIHILSMEHFNFETQFYKDSHQKKSKIHFIHKRNVISYR